MVYSRTLKISFSKLLQRRLDFTTENLWILFEGHYTPIKRNVSWKFQRIPPLPRLAGKISTTHDQFTYYSDYSDLQIHGQTQSQKSNQSLLWPAQLWVETCVQISWEAWCGAGLVSISHFTTIFAYFTWNKCWKIKIKMRQVSFHI